jgi:hypothetical protein
VLLRTKIKKWPFGLLKLKLKRSKPVAWSLATIYARAGNKKEAGPDLILSQKAEGLIIFISVKLILHLKIKHVILVFVIVY